MKQIFFVAFLILITGFLFAQKKQQHKIVFDFTKSDTASFATVVRHARNIMEKTGNAKLEIVCHGPGLDILLKDKSSVQKEVEELTGKYHVVFAACEETMKKRGIDKSHLLLQAVTVPAALIEISSKQEEGYSYVKEGY